MIIEVDAPPGDERELAAFIIDDDTMYPPFF